MTTRLVGGDTARIARSSSFSGGCGRLGQRLLASIEKAWNSVRNKPASDQIGERHAMLEIDGAALFGSVRLAHHYKGLLVGTKKKNSREVAVDPFGFPV